MADSDLPSLSESFLSESFLSESLIHSDTRGYCGTTPSVVPRSLRLGCTLCGRVPGVIVGMGGQP